MLQSTNMSRQESGFKNLIGSLPDDKIPRLGKVKRKFIKRFDEITTDTLNKQIELYDKLLSEDAIDASIHFYSTKEGQEIVAALPKINEGLSKLTFEFTNTLAKEFITELLELEPTEEEMAQIGFTKLSVGLDELDEDDDDEDDDDEEVDEKIVPKDDPDDIDDEKFNSFFKDYGL